MKFYRFLFLLLLPVQIFAFDWGCECECERDWTLEVRGACFYPSSKLVRHEFSSCWLDYQVEASKRIYHHIDVWAGVSWMGKRGHRDDYDFGIRERTKLSIVPISIGFKFVYPLGCGFHAYLGAGACYAFLTMKNDSDYSSYERSLIEDLPAFKKHIHKNSVGGIAKVGIQYEMGSSTFLDIFADYLTLRFNLSDILTQNQAGNAVFRNKFNCSGFKFGIGLGVYF